MGKGGTVGNHSIGLLLFTGWTSDWSKTSWNCLESFEHQFEVILRRYSMISFATQFSQCSQFPKITVLLLMKSFQCCCIDVGVLCFTYGAWRSWIVVFVATRVFIIIEKLWNSPGVSEITIKPHPNSRKWLKKTISDEKLEFTWNSWLKFQVNSRSPFRFVWSRCLPWPAA